MEQETRTKKRTGLRLTEKYTAPEIKRQNLIMDRLMRLGILRHRLAGAWKRNGGRLRHFVPEPWLKTKVYACVNGHVREGKREDGKLIPHCLECNQFALLFEPGFDEGELKIDIDIREQLLKEERTKQEKKRAYDERDPRDEPDTDAQGD